MLTLNRQASCASLVQTFHKRAVGCGTNYFEEQAFLVLRRGSYLYADTIANMYLFISTAFYQPDVRQDWCGLHDFEDVSVHAFLPRPTVLHYWIWQCRYNAAHRGEGQMHRKLCHNKL